MGDAVLGKLRNVAFILSRNDNTSAFSRLLGLWNRLGVFGEKKKRESLDRDYPIILVVNFDFQGDRRDQ
jgi:hypothetical protein